MNRGMKLWILAAVFSAALPAQPTGPAKTDPVQWTLSSDAAKAAPGAVVPLRLTAKLDAGWHLYSLTPTEDITPTTVGFAESPAVESIALYQPKPEKKFEPVLGHEVEAYYGEAVLLVQAQLKKDAAPGQAGVDGAGSLSNLQRQGMPAS